MGLNSSTNQQTSKLNGWKNFLALWRRLVEPSDSSQDEEQGRLSRTLAILLVLILPLIIILGMVVMPMVEKAPGLWQSATFPPALLAAYVSVIALWFNRSGRYHIAVGIYIFIFIFSPWWAVVRQSSIEILPIATLTVGGVLMASTLAPGRNIILYLSAFFSSVGVFILPWMIPGLSLTDIASVLGVIVTLNLIVLILIFYRNRLEHERQLELHTTNIGLRTSANYSEERLSELVEAIVGFSMLDFSVRAPIGENGDVFDAVATGLNALGEELEITFISKSKLEEEVSLRTHELAEANTELANFAHVVSHDLKAPLRAISQLSFWILEDHYEVLDEDGKEKLDMLVSRTRHMHKLIDDILQYSRVGRVTEKYVWVDLKQLLPEIIDVLDPPDNICVVMEDDLPVITGERTYITQVFQNLLSNAIRYIDKPDGHITIKCESKRDQWLFSIADNGPGIEEKYFEKIFQIFQTLGMRADGESTGIGLALVKRIVEKWGGKIWLESEFGFGSTFYFTKPARE